MIDRQKLIDFLDYGLEVKRHEFCMVGNPYSLGRAASYDLIREMVLDGDFDVEEGK